MPSFKRLFLLLVTSTSLTLVAFPLVSFGAGFEQAVIPLEGTSSTDLVTSINLVASAFLLVTTTIALLVLVSAGIQFILSQGDEEKTLKAKRTIFFAIAGLLVIGLSGAMVNFVLDSLPGRNIEPAKIASAPQSKTVPSTVTKGNQGVINKARSFMGTWLGLENNEVPIAARPTPELSCTYCKYWPVPECTGKNEAQCPDVVSALGQKECVFEKGIGCIGRFEPACRELMHICRQSTYPARCAMGTDSAPPATFADCRSIEYVYYGHANEQSCVNTVLPEIQLCLRIAPTCNISHTSESCSTYGNQQLVNQAINQLKQEYPNHNITLIGQQTLGSCQTGLTSGVTYDLRPNSCTLVTYDNCHEHPENRCHAGSTPIQCTDTDIPLALQRDMPVTEYCCRADNQTYTDGSPIYRWQRSSCPEPARPSPRPSPIPVINKCQCYATSIVDPESLFGFCPDANASFAGNPPELECTDDKYVDDEITEAECSSRNSEVVTGWYYRSDNHEPTYGLGELQCGMVELPQTLPIAP